MRQVYRKIPVYTGDVSGVCSALFELGGMIVMHDPSGCNSTYNTHDEIRWYDHDSLIFLSGLNEMEAVMGSDEALIRDIVDTARIYHPAFIAIANSPIPYIIGMDFDAICRIVEDETGIPAFYIPTNGMHDYTHGAGLAFLRLAERMLPEECTAADERSAGRIRCNVLGMTPLDFAASSTLKSLCDKMEEAGLEILSCWAMGDTLDAVRKSPDADATIVLSSTGLPAAQYLQDHFGIPFVAGFPAPGVEESFLNAVRKAVLDRTSRFPFRDRTAFREKDVPAKNEDGRTAELTMKTENRKSGNDHSTDGEESAEYGEIHGNQPVCLIGEPVIMTSLAASIEKETGARTHVYGATENSAPFLGPSDAALCGEEELADALSQTLQESHAPVSVIADPCYAEILPEGCRLVRLPHLAFSGRIFQKEIPDLLQWKPGSLT